MEETFDNHKFRGEDIDGLIDFTTKFNSVESFLAEVALLTNLDTDAAAQAEQTEDERILRLSTVHQAKGLEWKVVYILFVNEEMFPSKKTIEEQGDAEERRVFYVAVTRKTLSGTPEGGYEPDQKMSRMQALKSYTIDAAYGAFEEEIKGSIEVGKLADFTILDKDIMSIEEDEILNTRVEMTIVGGKVLYKRK